MMVFRIKEKPELIAEVHVLRAQLAMTVFIIKEKLVLTVEDHVLRAQLALMVFRIKEKLMLTVVDHVLRAKVKEIRANDINRLKNIFTIPTFESMYD